MSVEELEGGYEEAGGARGVLRPFGQAGVGEHRRLLPLRDVLREVIAHFWWIRWDLSAPFEAQTLPHPCVMLTLEASEQVPVEAGAGEGVGSTGHRAQVVGVVSRRFGRRLEGRGAILGLKFRAGCFGALWGEGEIARLRDRRLSAGVLLGEDCWEEASARLVGASGPEAMIAQLEALLLERLEELSAEQLALRDLVERVVEDRAILNVEQMAQIAGMGRRSLERRFRAHVGVSPAWVIRRYRLIEAAERLKRAPGLELAQLALELGYCDQAHFSRDFKAMVGCTPGEFSRERWSTQER